MPSLKQMIKNECDKDPSLSGRLTKMLGFAETSSALNKFLNNPKKETEFDNVLTIVQYLFPDREFELMSEYILTLNPKWRCARESLEYASINRLDDILQKMLDMMIDCGNVDSKEWAEVYQIDFDVVKGKIKSLEGINKLNDTYTKTIEMKIYKEISKFYCYSDRRLVGIMKETSSLIVDNLSLLEEGFIKRKYECHYNILIADVHLHMGNLDMVRKHVKMSINKIGNKNMLARLYHHLGKSYMLENYDQAYEFLNKGLNLSVSGKNALTNNEIKRTINLLNSYWSRGNEFLKVNNDNESLKADMAFFERNLDMIKSVDMSCFSDYGKGYYYFYLGSITNNADYHYESVSYFNMAGEKFFKLMPIIELRKLGEDERILKALSA